MRQYRTRKKKEYWFAKVSEWQSSGKSARAWCQENNVAYQSFLQWRRQYSEFNEPHPENLKADSFIELPNDSSHMLVEMEYRNSLVRISHIDSENLIECLRTLWSVLC
jgi:hypothetical protein